MSTETDRIHAKLRVIHDAACDGPTNMARDDVLLAKVGAGESPPTLRTYLWSPPTISLGYFQKYAEYVELPPPAGELAVVRRQTGGGAILHDRELTYAVVLPLTHPAVAENPNALYETAHDALIECLAARGVETHRDGKTDGSSPHRGPFFCFARRHSLDVLRGADKLVGSAQRRSRTAVLQHGSVMFERRFEQQPAAAIRESASIHADDLRVPFAEAMARMAGVAVEPGPWSAAELALADELIAKYSGEAWTRRI